MKIILLFLATCVVSLVIFIFIPASQETLERKEKVSVVVTQTSNESFGKRSRDVMEQPKKRALTVTDDFGNKSILTDLSPEEYLIIKAAEDRKRKRPPYAFVNDLEDDKVDGILKSLRRCSPENFETRSVSTWKEGIKAFSDSHLNNAPGVSFPVKRTVLS